MHQSRETMFFIFNNIQFKKPYQLFHETICQRKIYEIQFHNIILRHLTHPKKNTNEVVPQEQKYKQL